MKVMIYENDGTVIEAFQLSDSIDRMQTLRAFEGFAAEYGELDENDEPKLV